MSSRLRAALAASVVAVMLSVAGGAGAHGVDGVVRADVPPGAIHNIVVIDLENEDFDNTFGPTSPAVYLNKTLLGQGELIENYYATGHVSLDNYIAQVSGQAQTVATNNDCIQNFQTFAGGYFDVVPGTDAPAPYVGQVVGDGCVYPAPTATSHGAQTIGNQLDAMSAKGGPHITWRAYAEDMGNNPVRDFYGTPDPLGGTDCAHPPIGGTDNTNSASATDQFATRHVGFLYFRSVIDNRAYCDEHVVPLGTVTVGQNGAPDTFRGHLAEDFSKQNTTPAFSFITPNLCNDGHDSVCAGPNTEGTHVGGLVGADLWLKHWMPLILDSPAYRSGKMLVVITFDEAGASDSTACCDEPAGPNVAQPGFSTLLAHFGIQNPQGSYPGGGKVGAVVLNRKYIAPGSVDTTGSYNHYSALRSYEDLLGLTSGGDDGLGHLGFAAQPGLLPFGPDVFNAR
jgi:hypothetical protein